jgi:hypothetical protein
VTLTFGWNNVGSGTEPFCRVDYGDTNPMREGHLQVYREGVPLAAPCGEGLTPFPVHRDGPVPALPRADVRQRPLRPPGRRGPQAAAWTVSVTEFSEYAPAARACGETDRPRIIVGRLHTPPGDDRLTLKGRRCSRRRSRPRSIRSPAGCDYAALGANPPLKGLVVPDPPASATGQCAELAFPSEPAPSCGFERSGHTLRCR